MSLEIEKKYVVGNFTQALKDLSKDFGEYKKTTKNGFWFCNNYNGNENILDISSPKFFKKDINIIKDITETAIPDEDFQYLRLRALDNNSYVMTFKIKSIVNNIEKNSEYEFELEKDSFTRVIMHLKETAFIFYYNIKESYEFIKNDIKIELSKVSELKDAYLEVEATGDNEDALLDKLNHALKSLEIYNLKEEPKSYLELFLRENAGALKNLKLNQFSKKGLILLEEYL